MRAIETTSPGGIEMEAQTQEDFLVFFQVYFMELSKSDHLEGNCGDG